MKRNNFLVKCLITVITSAMLLLCLPLAGYCSEPLGSAESTSYEDDTVSANTSSCDAPIYEDSLTKTYGNDGLTEEKFEENVFLKHSVYNMPIRAFTYFCADAFDEKKMEELLKELRAIGGDNVENS